MRRVLVLEHAPTADLSGFARVLEARRSLAPVDRLTTSAHPPLPDHVDDLAGIVVMGGPVPAAACPETWLSALARLLRKAVAADVPVLAVGGGARLLAVALDGRVTRRAIPQAGYLPLARTAEGREDPVAAGWPDAARALLLHEDEVTTLPRRGVALLTGGGGVTAWRAGSAWGLGFHPEVTAAQLEAWLSSGLLADLLARSGAEADALVAETHRRNRFTLGQGRALMGRFLDGPVRARIPA